jgi:hypothetical protein
MCVKKGRDGEGEFEHEGEGEIMYNIHGGRKREGELEIGR